MDCRTDSFVRKFGSAKSYLKAQDIQSLVSLKYRQDVHDSVYRHFIDDLKKNSGIDVQRVDGTFGGQAWLVADKAQNSLILVEHETGLEILGAIGSVASLVALLPLITSGWSRLSRKLFGPPYDRPDADHEGIEVRQIGPDKRLIEQQLPSIEVFILSNACRDNFLLMQRVDQLENEVKDLKMQGPGTKKRTAESKRKKSRKKKR